MFQTDDYMVDENFKPTLIEVNSNPCLEFSSPMLKIMITDMINNLFMTSVDKLCIPPKEGSRTRACEAALDDISMQVNKFEELQLIRE